MRLFLAIVTFALCSLASAAPTLRAATAKSCGTSSYSATITSVAVTPSTPIKGQPVALSSAGTVSTAISGGTSELVVNLDNVKLFTHAGTTCGETTINFPLNFGTATLNGLPCPVAAGGSIAPGMNLTLPTSAPAGNYDLTIDAKDANSNEVYCLEVTFAL